MGYAGIFNKSDRHYLIFSFSADLINRYACGKLKRIMNRSELAGLI
jgi:hypothetical protein